MNPSHPKFCHPYDPYDIQLDFMSSLYECIENGSVGIFESPTGTGKSLSLICGALTWLRDNKRRAYDEAFGHVEVDPEDWLARAAIELLRKDLLRDREELEANLARLRDEENRKKRQLKDGMPTKKSRLAEARSGKVDDDAQFILDDYDSDTEISTVKDSSTTGLSATTQALLDQLKSKPDREVEATVSDETKLIFCSRTHSQLRQFINELRRVTPPPSINNDESGPGQTIESVKHLPLGSRKNLCINGKVSRLTSATAINERCIELQKPGIAKEHRCSYFPTRDDNEVVENFRNLAIARVRDIEDIASLGKEAQICPYYASRSAIAPSEVLTLPYPLLLQKSARDALGVSVKNNVVIIDEAHNLMDAIADSFSVSLRLPQLLAATQQIMVYVQKFKTKLKGKNRVYVTQVIRLLNSITDCLESMKANLKSLEIEVTASQLMAGKGVDQIRPHKLAEYIKESKLAYKVESYVEAQATDKQQLHHQRGILMQFQNLLMVLMNPASEGRFFASLQDGEVCIRYILLDPREHFRDIVQEARAVILAGGTMSPMSDYANYLFSYLPPDRLRTYTFGHVIPEDNIYVQTIAQGPTGKELEFTFEKRGSDATMQELGKLLRQICHTVPDGVVVFFPSYDYLSQVVQAWKRSPTFEALAKKKVVFEEKKGVTADDLLREYAQAIDSGKGAVMLSVVGGKLSEGINFSDKLGRAVLAIGLPFPNAYSGEWKAKIEHVEAARLKQSKEDQRQSAKECQAQAKAAGRDFYENACMRAVNQSIGRAIRHRNDYAAIMLVDRRFSTDRIRSKLPGWIRGSMASESGWQATEKNLQTFFASKQ